MSHRGGARSEARGEAEARRATRTCVARGESEAGAGFRGDPAPPQQVGFRIVCRTKFRELRRSLTHDRRSLPISTSTRRRIEPNHVRVCWRSASSPPPPSRSPHTPPRGRPSSGARMTSLARAPALPRARARIAPGGARQRRPRLRVHPRADASGSSSGSSSSSSSSVAALASAPRASPPRGFASASPGRWPRPSRGRTSPPPRSSATR